MRARDSMVRDQLEARGISHPGVLAALRRIRREDFLPPELAGAAYEDRALEIGEGQTLSQPYIAALMAQAADPRPGRRILEVGVGSGYLAAVLAEAGAEVYGVERLPALLEGARRRLPAAVRLKLDDGRRGWPEEAPFDAIVVSAAALEVPEGLLGQLTPEGVLVIPVRERLLVLDRKGGERCLEQVRFVPLLGAPPRP